MRFLRMTIFSLLVACAAGHANSAESLKIGSPAPSLDIEHWLSHKDGIAQFEKGKVYVVEFWATWCGPCVASIPHLSELQKRHGDAITVISVSDEKPETIETFLDREYGRTTFREMTSRYWLATDPDGSVKKDYMQAADQHGIPTAFIVGKTGLVEWIGHPMRIDEPVARVLAETWDRPAYAKQMEEVREVRRQLRAISEKMERDKKPEQALAMIDAIMGSFDSPEARQALELARSRIKIAVQGAAAAAVPGPVRHVEIFHLDIGDQVTVRITGRNAGPIWGDSVYTLDSDPGTAAVHAGLLRVGETKRIKIWVVPPPLEFVAANRNGIQSRRWKSYRAGIIMHEAATPAAAPIPIPAANRNIGLLRSLAVGESKTVTGSERNGALSAEWGGYPMAYPIKSVGTPNP